MTKRRKRHTSRLVARNLRDADAMRNGREELAVLQVTEISQAIYYRWRNQYWR